MSTFLLNFLLVVALSLPTVMATDGRPLPLPPPIPPMDPSSMMSDNLPGYPNDPSHYCQMLLHSEVPIPPEQMPWFCLCSQCQNTQGPKGSHGDQGPRGPPGSPGRRGLTGSRGPPGYVGRPGIKGQKGDDGQKGSWGLQGPVGPKGAQGFKGEKGVQGLEGHQGDPGPKGDDGVCPDNCESSQGPPGPPGLPGPAGSRGLPGTSGPPGPNGVKGAIGGSGQPGAPGPVGEKGELGPKGDCDCTDGPEGDPGQKGDKGDKGGEGETGPAGQTGPKGQKGELGEMGMMGRPGPCMPHIQSSFTARLTSSFPPPNRPVVFANVLYNNMENYDPTTGMYTAPINGTYVFSFHLTVYERVLKVGIFRNFRSVVKVTETNMFTTVSHSVILHLSMWDRVWLMVKNYASNGMYAGFESSSTFSGFLLHPDTCDMPAFRGFPPENSSDGEYSWGEDSESSTTKPTASPANGGAN